MHGKEPHAKPIAPDTSTQHPRKHSFMVPGQLSDHGASAFYSINFHWVRAATYPAPTADILPKFNGRAKSRRPLIVSPQRTRGIDAVRRSFPAPVTHFRRIRVHPNVAAAFGARPTCDPASKPP